MDEAELDRRVELYFLTNVIGIVMLKRIEMDDPGLNRLPVQRGLRMLRETSQPILWSDDISPRDLVDNVCTQVERSIQSVQDPENWCQLLTNAIVSNLDMRPIEDFYATILQFGRGQFPTPKVEITFKSLPLGYENVHSLDSDIQVTGSTYNAPGGAMVVIEFGEGCPKFQELCVLPYVVLHEVISHALAHESAVQSDGAFQDGWMDLVAIQVHERFIAEIDLEEETYSVLEFPERVLEFSSALHAARYKSSGTLRTGRDAGERIVQALSRVGLTLDTFWQVSHGLNRTTLSRSRRNAIAETVASRRRLSDTDLDSILLAFDSALDESLVVRAEMFAGEVLAHTYS